MEYRLINWLNSCVCAKNMSCLMSEHLNQKQRLLAECITHTRMGDETQHVKLMDGLEQLLFLARSHWRHMPIDCNQLLVNSSTITYSCLRINPLQTTVSIRTTCFDRKKAVEFKISLCVLYRSHSKQLLYSTRRKLHNEELNDLYCSPNIVRVIKSRIRWAGNVACMGERRGVFRVLVGKLEGKETTWKTQV